MAVVGSLSGRLFKERAQCLVSTSKNVLFFS